MQFYRVSDGTLPSLDQIREQNPEIGIPDGIEDLSHLGYEPYEHVSPPEINRFERVVPAAPVKEGDVWKASWTVTPWSPEEIVEAGAADKARKWEQIKAERDRRTQSGVKVGAHWFHSDSASRIQQLGLKDRGRDILAAGGTMEDPILILNQPVQWQTMGNIAVPMTVQLAFDIVKAIGDLDAMLFYTAKSHYTSMISASDPNLYNVFQGWPETFSER